MTSTSNNWSKSSGSLSAGETTAFTFDDSGTYRYRCTFHSSLSNGTCSGMCGKVVIS